MKNNYLYQGDYSELDNDIGWYDFALRSYDAQLGRFWQSDPYDQFPSPYTGMGNDPVNMIDPSGGFSLSGITGSANLLYNTAVTTFAGAFVGAVVGLVSGGNGGEGAMIGAGIGLGIGLGSVGKINPIVTNSVIGAVKATSQVINENSHSTYVSRIQSNISSGELYQSTTQSFATYVSYNQQNPIIIDNDIEALDHYFNGNQEPATIGPNSVLSLLTSWEFKAANSIIVSGLLPSNLRSGTFQVNMTNRIFHIGNTNVDYFIKCNTNTCGVYYSLFARDGFWDPDFIDENGLGRIPLIKDWTGTTPDGMGPNLERFGGKPYYYKAYYIKFTFKNPGY